MSIIAVIEPDFEFWQTGSDPGLPEGVWRATGVVTGDVSAGFQQLQVDFQKSTEPLSARMWSLEMIGAHCSNGITSMAVTAANLGEVLNAAPVVGLGFSVEFTQADSLGELPRGRDFAFLPWFLGAPRVRGVSAGISFSTFNVLGLQLDIWMRGYIWGPRSQTVQGGPRRPVGSVFGRS